MNTVKGIIERAGYGSAIEMNAGENIEVSAPGVMDLTIEKIGQDRLSVAHYWTQRGDMMWDPEVVFEIGNSDWRPVEYRQDPLFHQMDSNGLDIDDFLETWNDNLEAQGFLEDVSEAASHE